MKKTNSFVKGFIALLTAGALVLAGCNDLSSSTETASLDLNQTYLSVTSALEGRTVGVLEATLTGTESELEWYSTNKNVVILSASGSTATLYCGGTAGTSKVGVRTADGSLEKSCTVKVELSGTPADAPKNVTLLDSSETQTGFTITWEDPSVASKIVIKVYEKDSDEVYKTYTVALNKESYTITDLVTDAVGKEYDVEVYGSLNGNLSSEKATLSVTLAPDSTAPGNAVVNESTSVISDHSITLVWTDPSDADFSSVTVSISPAVDFKGNALTGTDAEKTVSKAIQTATFENLSADTEYTFTLITKDVSGNVQGDSNNSSNAGTTASFTTAEDTTAPDNVENAEISAGRNSATLVWNDSESTDFKEIHVYQGDSSVYTNVLSGVETLQISDLESLTAYSFTVKAVDYDGNESSGVVLSASTSNPIATNVTLSADYTTNAVITWNAPTAVEYANDILVTYAYVITASDGDSVVATKNVATGEDLTVTFTELDLDTTYTFTVKVVPSDDTESQFYDSTKSVASGKPPKVLWRIRNGQYPNDARYMTPCILTEEPVTVSGASLYSDAHVCLTNTSQAAGTASGGNYYCDYSYIAYTHWLVYPALDGTDGAFSLMASNASGDVSDYWLYFDSGTTRTVPGLTECYQAAWWTTQSVINAISNKAFVAKLDGSDNSGTPWFTDMTRASFNLEASTNTTTVSGYEGATRIKATNDLYLYNPDGHTQFAGSSSIADEKYAAFWYVETFITE